MRQRILNKKLPSLLAISIISFGIVLTLFLNQRTNLLQTNASPGDDPKNIQVTNITDSSFTITYTTDDLAIGTIDLGETSNDLNQKFLDERDANSQTVNSYKSHSIVVSNLKPETEYFYKITSGKKITTKNGNPFKITTGSKMDGPQSKSTPLVGKIINPDGSELNDGIVIVKTNESNLISTIVTDGNFTIPLKNLRSKNLEDYLDTKDSIISLEIRSGDLSSLVRISGNQKSPLPITTLSNNYDFVIISPLPVRVINSKSVKFPKFKSKIKTLQSSFRNLTPSTSLTNIPSQ